MSTFCRPAEVDPWAVPPRGCVTVPHVCFEREQILLHGPTAAEFGGPFVRQLRHHFRPFPAHI